MFIIIIIINSPQLQSSAQHSLWDFYTLYYNTLLMKNGLYYIDGCAHMNRVIIYLCLRLQCRIYRLYISSSVYATRRYIYIYIYKCSSVRVAIGRVVIHYIIYYIWIKLYIDNGRLMDYLMSELPTHADDNITFIYTYYIT